MLRVKDYTVITSVSELPSRAVGAASAIADPTASLRLSADRFLCALTWSIFEPRIPQYAYTLDGRKYY